MAVVNLRTMWLNDATNPSDGMNFPFMSSLQVTTAVRGEVRQLSAGRLRYIQQAGVTRSVAATLPALTRAQLAWLESHAGVLLCVRDDRGRKLWVVYTTLGVDEHRYNEEGNSSLALSEVSYSEAV